MLGGREQLIEPLLLSIAWGSKRSRHSIPDMARLFRRFRRRRNQSSACSSRATRHGCRRRMCASPQGEFGNIDPGPDLLHREQEGSTK